MEEHHSEGILVHPPLTNFFQQRTENEHWILGRRKKYKGKSLPLEKGQDKHQPETFMNNASGKELEAAFGLSPERIGERD